MDNLTPHTDGVIWPAIIHYHGQAELGFVLDQQSWSNAQYIQTARYHIYDELIDSIGRTYRLVNQVNAPVSIEPIGKITSLQDVIEMIRMHASVSGTCCVAKFSATSIQEAIGSLAIQGDS
ncbi:MAG: DUF4144 family protein [Methylophilaceae bacterium]|jgi:hypothetical protein|nr:DUF4144 family protein [Methyloradius sp.]